MTFSTCIVEPDENPAPERCMVSPSGDLVELIVVLKWRFVPRSTNFVAMAFSNHDRRTAVFDLVGF